MTIPPELLQHLVCPLSHVPLQEAAADQFEMILKGLADGRYRTRGAVDWNADQVDGMLVTAIGDIAYPLIDGVPNLLPTACILVTE